MACKETTGQKDTHGQLTDSRLLSTKTQCKEMMPIMPIMPIQMLRLLRHAPHSCQEHDRPGARQSIHPAWVARTRRQPDSHVDPCMATSQERHFVARSFVLTRLGQETASSSSTTRKQSRANVHCGSAAPSWILGTRSSPHVMGMFRLDLAPLRWGGAVGHRRQIRGLPPRAGG